jgi:hypothetical protein
MTTPTNTQWILAQCDDPNCGYCHPEVEEYD